MILSGNVDLIVLTHPDDDHRNGLSYLFAAKRYRKD
jgi:beta-lactamase superfamily II metal-dependent hydrolase